MKKNYMTPSSMVSFLELQQMIAASDGGVRSAGDVTDITYGGVDTDGKKNPSSRRGNVWEDEELEEEEY